MHLFNETLLSFDKAIIIITLTRNISANGYTVSMMLSKEKKGNRIRQSISLFVSLLISALLFSSHVSALAIQDLPLNDGNRTLTRISIKRTYPLNDSELQKLSQPDRQLLDKDDYGVLAFRSAYTTDANAKRMIIMLHGFGRDAWQYQDTANDALYEAIGLTDSPDQNDIKKLKLDETLIVSPQFINEEDMELYYQTNDLQFDDVANLTTYDSPSIETTLVWQNTSWAEGADSILPTNITSPPDQEGNSRLIKAPSMSSFEVMDAMVDQATNKTRYPKLETIIVAGHSLGAQFVQRYALIGAIPSKQIPVHFFIANPGSYVYLTDKRPRSTKNCTTTYNEWKFGLGVFGIRYLYNMVVTSLDTLNDITDVRVRYLRDRQVHYLYGLNDTGNNGDRRCQAMSRE